MKFIDADKRLSLQVHPDEMTARKYPGSEAKNEYGMSWITKKMPRSLQAYDMTELNCSFDTRVGKDDVEDACSLSSRKGDAFYLPASWYTVYVAGNLV